jgi:molybdopterin synthase sulfur carrier subunit
MATVLLPRSLVELFVDVPRRLEVPGEDVGALIRDLDGRWPGMADRLCETGPRIRPFINVFVDGQQAELDTAVAPTSTVHIIPAVAGGSPMPLQMPVSACTRPCLMAATNAAWSRSVWSAYGTAKSASARSMTSSSPR